MWRWESVAVHHISKCEFPAYMVYGGSTLWRLISLAVNTHAHEGHDSLACIMYYTPVLLAILAGWLCIMYYTYTSVHPFFLILLFICGIMYLLTLPYSCIQQHLRHRSERVPPHFVVGMRRHFLTLSLRIKLASLRVGAFVGLGETWPPV